VFTGLRLPAIKVEVLKKNSKRFKTCQVVRQPLLAKGTQRIYCRPRVKGSIVRIASTGNDAIGLSLCDVEVYGVPGKELAVIYFIKTNTPCYTC